MSSYRNKRPLKLILWSSQCKFWSVKPSTSPFLWPNLGKTEKNQIRKICTAAPSQLKAIAEKQGQHVEWLPLIIILMNIGNNYYFQWILIQCTNSYLQPPFRGANTSSAPCMIYLPNVYPVLACPRTRPFLQFLSYILVIVRASAARPHSKYY